MQQRRTLTDFNQLSVKGMAGKGTFCAEREPL